jgi:hypothetical protein
MANGGIIGPVVNPVTTLSDLTTAFTVSGTYIAPSVGPLSATYLIVAGGGGGASYALGGGGAGGLRTITATLTGGTSYPVTVGGGGAGSRSPGCGAQGTNSIFNGITSQGGGGGGNYNTPGPVSTDGSAGGSGGAIGRDAYLAGRTSANNGNSPPVSPSQGNPGGVNIYPIGSNSSAGGGGAGAAGTNTSGNTSTAGGVGVNVQPTFGTAPQPFYPVTGPGAGYFGGGGGGGYFKCSPGCGAAGGLGGGGTGGAQPLGRGSDGTTNSGGGGGGGNNPGSGPAPLGGGSGGSGGSGIVIVKQTNGLSTTAAPGVWSINDAYNYKKAGQWS